MENLKIEDIIVKNSMDYSAYVLLDRCLPDLRDGMKPVHRRIIYTMHKMGATKFTKSANVTGEVMALHPHGDCYDSVVNMVQKDKQNIPFLEGKGNFSSHTSRDLMYGASRYTETRLSELSKDIVGALKYKTVNFIPNYDGSLMMPEVLPVNFPTILTHCNIGIGVGMSSSIAPFNLNELAVAIKKYIDEGETTLLVPDFATGGFIVEDKTTFEKINAEGRGTVKLRGKASIDKNIISITEIPYTTSREAIIEKIIELNKEGKLKEVSDVKDLTGLKGMLVEVTLKKNVDAEMVLEKLYQNTPLESSFSVNMNMLHNGLPKVMGVWEVINNWLSWRVQCVKLGLANDIQALQNEIRLLDGLAKIVDHIDEVINIIRNSKKNFVIAELMDKFPLTEEQAKYIANMKLININKEEIQVKLQEYDNMKKTIGNKKKMMQNDKLLLSIISKQIMKISEKYGSERKSQLITVSKKMKEKIIKIKNEVEDYQVRVICTKEGYVKKLSVNTKADNKLKEGDEIVDEFITSNKAELLIFSGTDCFKLPLSKLEDMKPNVLGSYMPSVVGCKGIVGYSILDEKNKFILVSYANDKIAKVDLKSFETSTQRKKLSKSLNDVEVNNILTYESEGVFVIVNKKEKEKEMKTNELTTKASRNTQGVNTIKNIAYIKRSV